METATLAPLSRVHLPVLLEFECGPPKSCARNLIPKATALGGGA